MIRRALLFAALFACNGTSGSSSPADATAPHDAGCDATDCSPPPAPAPFACGTMTCGVNQYCISPCCGGAPPDCAFDDAGSCPPGFHYVARCSNRDFDSAHCEADPCKPPPSFCSDDARGCPAGADPEPGVDARHVGCACP